MLAHVPTHDALGVELHRRPKVASGRQPSAYPTYLQGVAVLAASAGRATATEEAMVGPRRRVPVARATAVARRPVPVGLAKRVALGATSTPSCGIADGKLLERGKAALASAVVTTGASTVVEASLVLTAWPSKARATVHVGRGRVASS